MYGYLYSLQLQLTNLIDNTWTLAIERADLCGRELAKALLMRTQGSRPVTLVGFSIGSRVIFSCLRELSVLLRKSNNENVEEDVYQERQSMKSCEREGSATTALPASSAKRLAAFSTNCISGLSSLRCSSTDLLDEVIASAVEIATSPDSPTQLTPEQLEKLRDRNEYLSGLSELIQDVVILGSPVDSRVSRD